MADVAGRVEPLAPSDSIEDYCGRLGRLNRVRYLAGQFLAASLEQDVVAAEEYEAVARDFAAQAANISRELKAWRKANPDPEGRW